MTTSFEIEVTRKVKISLDDFMVYCASLYPDQSKVNDFKRYIFTNLFHGEITFILPPANTEVFDFLIELQRSVRDEAEKEGIKTRIVNRQLNIHSFKKELDIISQFTLSEVAMSVSFIC